MTLTNAEKQARWRERRNGLANRAITGKDSDQEIVWKLIRAVGFERARAIGAQLDKCPTCEGTGQHQLQAVSPCRVTSRDGVVKSCPGKVISTTEPFPCPTCRPADYAVASGVELRNQGQYVEALKAATDLLDDAAAGETLLAWRANAKEIQRACDAAGYRIAMTDIRRLRDYALNYRKFIL